MVSYTLALRAPCTLARVCGCLARALQVEAAHVVALDDDAAPASLVRVDLQSGPGVPGTFAATLHVYPSPAVRGPAPLDLARALAADLLMDVVTSPPADWPGNQALHWALVHPTGRAHRVPERPAEGFAVDERPTAWQWPPFTGHASAPWLRFLHHIEARQSTDGLIDDVTPVLSLAGDDRSAAVDLLFDLATGRGDRAAIHTLAALRAPGAADWMGRLGGSPWPDAAAAARRVQAQLAPSAAASAALARGLPSVGPVERVLSVNTLAAQPDDAAARALLDALRVDDFFVRTTAWDGLIARTGLAPTTGSDDFGPLSALHLRVLTSIKSIWHPAAGRACGLFRRLLDGEDPAQVVPAYVPGDPARRAQALDALRRTGDAPIDIAPLAALEGHDRAWFDAALLTRVGRQDVRAIRAAAALQVKGLSGALQEARGRWSPMADDVRAAVDAALRDPGASRR